MNVSKRINKIFLFGLAAVLAGSGLIAACGKEEQKKLSNQDIFLYRGPDRDQKIIDQARKEGEVSVYTSMTLKDWEDIARAFEQKYGVKTKVRRAQPDKIVYGAM